MAMGRRAVVVGMLVGLMVAAAVGQPLSDVCKDVPNDLDHNNKRPQIGDQFHVHVECQLSEQNQTAFVHEYYDNTRNRGRLTVQKPYSLMEYYMDYDQNMLLMVNPDNSVCQAGLLLLSEDKFVFGYKMQGFNSQMYSPSAALHFSNVNESYNGTNDVRGIVVDEWHSCQYLPSINATAHVVWFFSQKENWDMQLGQDTTPVRMMAVGKQVMADGSVKPFSHVYDFFDFNQTVDLKDLEVPSGIYCPDRSLLAPPKPFPAIPVSFFFIGEINDPFSVEYSYLEEAFDNTTKYSMYNFKGDSTSLTGVNQYTELNDFNTGVSYLVDNDAGSCTLTSVKDGSMAFTKQVNGQQVRMKTPREFFMDQSVQYQYAGTRDVRGISCDRWVGVTNTAQGFEGQNVTVEWYFATDDHESWNVDTTSYRIPILFQLFLHGDVTSQSYQFHIFYFGTQYYLADVDISQCYKDTQRKTLRFSIPKSSEAAVRQNTLQFKQSVQTAISLATGISPLRTDNIQLYFNPLNVWVTFDLLDSPPRYDDVVGSLDENSLSRALGLLNDSFNSHAFQFFFASGSNVVTLSPNYDSFEDITDASPSGNGNSGTGNNGNGNNGNSGNGNNGNGNNGNSGNGNNGNGNTGNGNTGNTGNGNNGNGYNANTGGDNGSDLYSGGALAGLGIAMLIIGGAGGATGGFFIFRR